MWGGGCERGRWRLPAEAAALPLVRASVSELAGHVMRSTDELERVRLAVTEACANAVRHAYPEGGGVLDVRVLVDAAEVVIEVRDMGIGLRLHPPVPAKPGITRLGLDLIHALADVVEIHDLGPGTSVKMTFRPR